MPLVRMRVEDAQRVLLGGHVATKREVEHVVIAFATAHGSHRVVRRAVIISCTDTHLLIRPVAPRIQHVDGGLLQHVAVIA